MSASPVYASVGYTLPTTHSVHRHLSEASREIAIRSQGALELRLHPHEEFGSDIAMLEAVFDGELQVMVCTGAFLGRKVPAAAAPSVPFVFDDLSSVWRAVDGELGNHVRSRLLSAGVYALPHPFDNGFRHLTTSERSVIEAKDVQGMMMRVVAAPLHQSLWSALGTTTIPSDVVDVRELLESGKAEAQDNSLPMIEAFGLHEVQKRCALTSHMWEGFWIVVNLPFWKSLPRDSQDILADAMSQCALAQRKTQEREETALRGRMRIFMQFNEVNRDSFIQELKAKGYYDAWQERLGAETWKMLQAAAGRSANFS